MLKHIFTFVLFACTTIVNAQKVELGAEIAGNLIPTQSSNLGIDFQFGGYGGLGVKYIINDRFNLRTGLFISQQKKTYKSLRTNSIFDEYKTLFQLAGIEVSDIESALNGVDVNLDVKEQTEGIVSEIYLQLPIMIDFKIKKYNISLGPYAGFLLAANRTEELSTTIPLFQVIDIGSFDSSGMLEFILPSEDETDVNTSTDQSGLQKFDIGATIGIGYTLNRFLLNLSYSQGFLDYRTGGGHDSFSAHQAIRFSLSYFLPLGAKNKGEPKKKVKTRKTNPTLK